MCTIQCIMQKCIVPYFNTRNIIKKLQRLKQFNLKINTVFLHN